MTTLRGSDGSKVQYSISNVIHELNDNGYVVELPILVCSNRRDAELMQKEIATFVSKLSKAVLEDL